MESCIESALRLRSRVRNIESIDSEIMDNTNRVTIINISESHLIATNHLIYNICKNVLQNKDINSENHLNKVSVDSQSSQLDSQEILFSLSNQSNNGVNKETIDCLNPIIIIYDGFGAFDLIEFSNHLSNICELENINIYRAFDENELLIALNNDLSTHLALNHKLKFIVIYANSSNIYPQIVDKINEILFSLVISVHIVLVVDRINKIQTKDYLQRSSFQIIGCKSIGFTQIEIKNQRNGITFKRDVSLKPQLH